VPDNWKSGVKQPCYYEPELNPTYNDLAVHYGVRHPADAAISSPG
jgi:hypothetical protein